MSQVFEEFQKYLQTKNQYDYVTEVLSWDGKTVTPKMGQKENVEAVTFFASQSFDMSTSDEMKGYLDALSQPQEYEALDDTWKFIIRRMKKDFDRNSRIPSDLYEEYVRAQAESGNAWVEAKNENDYSLFAPHLQKMIDYTKKITAYTDPGKDVYDALLDQYEEGMDSATIDALFTDLKTELVPLVDQILEAPQPDDTPFRQYFDPDAQKKVQKMLLEYMGLNWDAGAAGESEHPFTMGLSSRDVRITNHYHADMPLSAIFSAIHEGGHAIFEQNVNPDYDRTVAGGCRYLGIHESQSRFYENILARNKNFWVPIYDKLGQILPGFAQIPLDDFYREINHVRNSLIRTEADEVTYCFHIIIRYEIEKAIFRDNVTVDELPALWNRKMEEYLHIVPPTDSEGILQDMHWSDGSFGYFPSYLLGSIYDGMFLETMEKELGSVDELLASGRIGEITKWLNENIHRYGSTRTPKEVIENVCGEEVSAKPLIRYFKKKYTQIYDLKKE